jgi:hypothetical protein
MFTPAALANIRKASVTLTSLASMSIGTSGSPDWQ